MPFSLATLGLAVIVIIKDALMGELSGEVKSIKIKTRSSPVNSSFQSAGTLLVMLPIPKEEGLLDKLLVHRFCMLI